MTIDDLIARTRAGQPGDTPSTFLVYTLGPKEFFHGELIDTSSPDAILLRQLSGAEILIFRRHIVAITPAAA